MLIPRYPEWYHLEVKDSYMSVAQDQHDSVLEKIEKLLRTAGDAAATVSEAEAASLAAQRIAHKHNIDLSRLGTAYAKSDATLGIAMIGHNLLKGNHRKMLLATLATNFQCRAIVFSDPDTREALYANLVGTDAMVAVVVKLFQFMLDVADRECMSYCLRNDAHMLDLQRREKMRSTWLEGFATGVKDKFKEQVESTPGMGLMLVPPPAVTAAADEVSDGTKVKLTSDVNQDSRTFFYGYYTGKTRTDMNDGELTEGDTDE